MKKGGHRGPLLRRMGGRPRGLPFLASWLGGGFGVGGEVQNVGFFVLGDDLLVLGFRLDVGGGYYSAIG